MATTVTWTLNGMDGALTGFSHCYSRNAHGKDVISVQRLDEMFGGNLLYVEGAGNKISIKNTRNGEWSET